MDASGGQAINTAPVASAITAPNGRKENGSLESFDASNIVEVNEEEVHLDDGSEEMSVAIDLAKLSQGHFSHNDFKNSGYVSIDSQFLLIFDKIHILKFLFLTKFTFSKFDFLQNSHL